MDLITAVIKDAHNVGKKIAAEADFSQKCLDDAMKIKAARLTQSLLAQIRSGVIAGTPLKELSFLARRGKGNNFTLRKPFTRLNSTSTAGSAGAKGFSRYTLPVRYSVNGTPGNLDIRFGFVDTRQEKLSPSWKRLMIAHQEGFSRPVTEKQRRWFMNRGVELSGYQYHNAGVTRPGPSGWSRKMTKRGTEVKKSASAKFYFWKKSVTHHVWPARPIILPFWAANKDSAWTDIRDYYRRKLNGERI